MQNSNNKMDREKINKIIKMNQEINQIIKINKPNQTDEEKRLEENLKKDTRNYFISTAFSSALLIPFIYKFRGKYGAAFFHYTRPIQKFAFLKNPFALFLFYSLNLSLLTGEKISKLDREYFKTIATSDSNTGIEIRKV